MKQTPLTRRTPLRTKPVDGEKAQGLTRGSELKRTKGLSPGKGLKSGKGLKAKPAATGNGLSDGKPGSSLKRSQSLSPGTSSLGRSDGAPSRAKSLKRGSGPKAKPKASMSAKERKMAAAWISEVARRNHAASPTGELRCCICGIRAVTRLAVPVRSGGMLVSERRVKLEGHHIVAQQHIAALSRDLSVDEAELRWDPALGVLLCAQVGSNRCHENHTSSMVKMSRASLPSWTLARISQLGLDAYVERYYA